MILPEDTRAACDLDTLGVGTTEFDLSDDKKAALVESGRVNTQKYFAWYDNPASSPANRP